MLVWIHGGGFVIGSAVESQAHCRDPGRGRGCVVVSLDYRLAPEHKAPAALDDCIAATTAGRRPRRRARWRPEQGRGGRRLGRRQPFRTVALEFGDRLCYQVLVYPATDLSMSGDYPSLEENADGYLLERASMDWFVGHYLDGSGLASDDVRISPINASDEALSRTPPAFVITAEFDPLRDEGEAYADRLRAAGVDVTQRRFDGQIHAFYSMPLAIPAGAEAVAQTVELLRKAFV